MPTTSYLRSQPALIAFGVLALLVSCAPTPVYVTVPEQRSPSGMSRAEMNQLTMEVIANAVTNADVTTCGDSDRDSWCIHVNDRYGSINRRWSREALRETGYDELRNWYLWNDVWHYEYRRATSRGYELCILSYAEGQGAMDDFSVFVLGCESI